MARFQCSKCGAKATSKCPNERTIFLDKQEVAMLSYVLHVKSVEFREGSTTSIATVNFDMQYAFREDEEGEEDAIDGALQMLTNLPADVRKIFACTHRWIGDKCDFGHDHSEGD